jgi:NAD(P)H dehydrogenase (quinone)
VFPGTLLAATVVFAQAATEAGVTSVVNMSQISARREAKSNAAQQHWLAERFLDRCAFTTTHLRPTFFAEWLRWVWLRNDDGGVLQLPFGDGRHAPIAGEDQAKVIAAILQNPLPHDRQIYPLFGAEQLDHHQIAAQMSAALGFPVRYESFDIPTFGAAMTANGRPDFFVQHLSSVAQDYRDGIFAGENNLVEVISGSKPLTVAEFVDANRSAFDHDGPYSLRKELPQQ